ncbi:MAG: transcription antitermination factor NusB [Chloroflexota bacterium]|nr:transcription antitermination factor NusB [Chloroflexota bacterium]
MAPIRHKARIVALQVLFEFDCSGHDAETSLDWLAAEQALPESALSFAQELVRGVLENKEQIDSLIKTYAPNWPVEQLSTVDRNILRLAIFEILINNKTEFKVAINEAVELAKAFGSYNSYKFINGVLRTIGQIQINS